MKEEIYTIPVMDGFKEDCECPFCAMKRTLENNTINYVLSPSYMEEDVRGETTPKASALNIPSAFIMKVTLWVWL